MYADTEDKLLSGCLAEAINEEKITDWSKYGPVTSTEVTKEDEGLSPMLIIILILIFGALLEPKSLIFGYVIASLIN
jgi:hypothetical protein